MRNFLIASMVLLSTTAGFANSLSALDAEIGSFTVTEIDSSEVNGMEGDVTGGVEGGVIPVKPGSETNGSTTGDVPGGIFIPDIPTYGSGGYSGGWSGGWNQNNDNVDRFGRVVAVAKDIVGLGEAIYELVKKGKPSNTTEYAPISIVPRDPLTKEVVSPFDLENFSMPTEQNYKAVVTNSRGKEVVVFKYKVVYSYGGSYNESGKYLTNVIIIPSEVKTSFGWDFSAKMQMTGIYNHGSKANPVAGVLVTMKYQMNSWLKAFERNDTIHITGAGQVKVHNAAK